MRKILEQMKPDLPEGVFATRGSDFIRACYLYVFYTTLQENSEETFFLNKYL